jgi:hypothetical protein
MATGSCSKCESEISETVDRCPECGYEPGPSMLGKLFFWFVALPWTVFTLFAIGVSFFGVLTGDMTGGEFFGGVFALIILFSIPIWYTMRYRDLKQRKPVDSAN